MSFRVTYMGTVRDGRSDMFAFRIAGSSHKHGAFCSALDEAFMRRENKTFLGGRYNFIFRTANFRRVFACACLDDSTDRGRHARWQTLWNLTDPARRRGAIGHAYRPAFHADDVRKIAGE